IQAKLQEQPSYCPTDIIKDMRRDHGLQIGYWTAWHAKEAASTNINGSHESAFNKLPQYCQDIIRTNSGSFAILIIIMVLLRYAKYNVIMAKFDVHQKTACYACLSHFAPS